MREILRERDYTFIEMAKVVGERWQDLPAMDRETFEGKAGGAKERYLDEFSAYKRTDHYAEYMQYLADFKAKNNSDSGIVRLDIGSIHC